MQILVTRRRLLLALVATGASAAAGAAWTLTADNKSFLAEYLQRLLPNIRFAPGALEDFAADYLAYTSPDRVANIQKLSWIARLIGQRGLDLVLGGNAKVRRFQRTTVSILLVSTDYFSNPDTDEPASYIGLLPDCGRNPFAEFD